MAITNDILNELIGNAKTQDDLFGKYGVLKELSKQLMEKILQTGVFWGGLRSPSKVPDHKQPNLAQPPVISVTGLVFSNRGYIALEKIKK